MLITDLNNGPKRGPILKEMNAIHTLAHSVVMNKKTSSTIYVLVLKVFSLPIPTKNMPFSKDTYMTFDYLRPTFDFIMR